MTNEPTTPAASDLPFGWEDRLVSPPAVQEEGSCERVGTFCPLCGYRACMKSPTPSPAIPDRIYGADHQPWCQPGDQTERAFRLRFEDPDMREMVFTGPDAESEALAAYNKYAPTWNVYLFSGHPRGPIPDREEIVGVLRRLTFAARTTGGTAGPDAGLMAACDEAETILESIEARS